MKYVSLTLTRPPAQRNDMHTFIVETPGYEETALLRWNASRPGIDVFLFRVLGPIEPYREAIRQPSFVREFDLTPIDDDAFYAYVENEPRDVDESFQAPFLENHVLTVPPIVFDADGTTKLRVVGHSDTLQQVIAELPEHVDVTVDEIGEFDAPWAAPVASLTDRQRDALDAAFALGYYEVPREGTIDDVAEELDCAPSTASTHLRKAERELVASIVRQ